MSKRKNPGKLYVVGVLGSRRCKIGRSCSPDRRIAALLTAAGLQRSEVRIFITEMTQCANAAEKAAHDHFKDARVSGEWFECDFDDAVSVVKGFIVPATRDWLEDYHSKQGEGVKKLISCVAAMFSSSAEKRAVAEHEIAALGAANGFATALTEQGHDDVYVAIKANRFAIREYGVDLTSLFGGIRAEGRESTVNQYLGEHKVTGLGSRYARCFDTGEDREDGSPVLELRWTEDVLKAIQ